MISNATEKTMTNPIGPDETSPAMEDHFTLEEIACRLCQTYTQAVADGTHRVDLAKIITGLAGVELAQSCTAALGWEQEPDEGGWSVADTDHLAGLLLLEVATCAGGIYRGIELIEALEIVTSELIAVADAYAGSDSVLIGQRLFELGCAVGEKTGSAAGEALLPLIRAHGFISDIEDVES